MLINQKILERQRKELHLLSKVEGQSLQKLLQAVRKTMQESILWLKKHQKIKLKANLLAIVEKSL